MGSESSESWHPLTLSQGCLSARLKCSTRILNLQDMDHFWHRRSNHLPNQQVYPVLLGRANLFLISSKQHIEGTHFLNCRYSLILVNLQMLHKGMHIVSAPDPPLFDHEVLKGLDRENCGHFLSAIYFLAGIFFVYRDLHFRGSQWCLQVLHPFLCEDSEKSQPKQSFQS